VYLLLIPARVSGRGMESSNFNRMMQSFNSIQFKGICDARKCCWRWALMAVVVWVALSMNASARSAKSFSTATLVAAADYLPCGEGCSALANQASAFCFRVGDQTLVGEGSSYLHEGKFAGAKEFAGKQIQLRFSRRSIWIKPPDSSVMKLSRGSQFENFQDAGCIREVRKPLLAAANAHRRPAKVPGTAFALAGTGKGDRYLWYQCDLDSDKAEIACRSWYRNGDLLGRDWYCARTAAGEPVKADFELDPLLSQVGRLVLLSGEVVPRDHRGRTSGILDRPNEACR